jgi:hypothetical protein
MNRHHFKGTSDYRLEGLEVRKTIEGPELHFEVNTDDRKSLNAALTCLGSLQQCS